MKFITTSSAGLAMVSRRGFVLSLAAAAPAVLLKTAGAQGDVWREYRPADLPFRIAMPGEPQVETEQNEYKDEDWIRNVDANVPYEKAIFGTSWQESRTNKSLDRLSSLFREGMQRTGMAVTREMSLTVAGFPAREFVSESQPLGYIHRLIVIGKDQLHVSVTGEKSIHGSPSVRRFFDSLQLLRTAP